VFTDVTVEAGKTVKLEKTITMTETAEYQFTVTGMEGTNGIETATGRLPLTAIDPAKAPSLTVENDCQHGCCVHPAVGHPLHHHCDQHRQL